MYQQYSEHVRSHLHCKRYTVMLALSSGMCKHLYIRFHTNSLHPTFAGALTFNVDCNYGDVNVANGCGVIAGLLS